MSISQNIRALFLEEFVKRMIISSLPIQQKIAKDAVILERLEEASSQPPKLEIKKQPEAKQQARPAVIYPKVLQQAPSPAVMPPRQIIPKAIEAQKVPEKTSLILERLKSILADPAVQSISCPGPNKSITITRMGIVQTLGISFAAGEIEAFLKDLSEKTHIPLLPGLFKVIFQNIIITAVVSEFIGTKFVIEKRPMQTLPPMPIRAQFK